MDLAAFSSFLLLSVVGLSSFSEISALECYVCTEQEGNIEKCLSTVRTCEPEEDTCQSVLRWGSTPYWDQGAEKQYYVTKRCATRDNCEKLRDDFTPHCQRIWYEDWKCAECCQGDRCNYYIIMGAGNLQICGILILMSSITTVLLSLWSH